MLGSQGGIAGGGHGGGGWQVVRVVDASAGQSKYRGEGVLAVCLGEEERVILI